MQTFATRDTNSTRTDDDSSDNINVKGSFVQSDADKETVTFITTKKKEMKETKYRKRFDNFAEEVDNNLINTTVSYGEKLYERTGWGSVLTYTKTAQGNTDVNVYPQKLNGRDQNRSGVPVSQEPIAFSKIITATSVLAGGLPDADVQSDNKVYSKASYELWKRTWANRLGNGSNTLMTTYQNLFTYGWAAWRVYPRRVQVPRGGVDKIMFDDIYREPMDPLRTWMGACFNNYDGFSQYECYYEKDLGKELFFQMYPEAETYADVLNYTFGVTDEAKNENNDKTKNEVTISYYENVLMNRFITTCGDMVIYDGEMPNDDSFGSLIFVRCFARNMNDPHGVGLYEMMRGNTAIYTYINSLNAQQVEAEIFPLIFGAQVQNGTSTYKRGPNVVNPKTPGTTLDIVNTKGNIQGGIAFANQQKQDIQDNTGINDIVAGQSSETTLGSTVILAEAALKRLVIPRNGMVDGLELDALIAHSWIKQTYSVDKAFMVTDDQELQQFATQNPDYFLATQSVVDDTGTFKGYAIAASPNLRLNFDFDANGKLMENVDTRKISAKSLFDEMNNHGITSPYINFVIDPTSMLLPSKEIEKQQYMTMFPIINTTIAQIFNLQHSNPKAAASTLMALECLVEKYNYSIYDYISVADYNEVMSQQPVPINVPPVKKLSELMPYAVVPEDIKRQMEAQAGFTPSKIGGTTPPPTPTGITPPPFVQPTPPQGPPAPPNNIIPNAVLPTPPTMQPPNSVPPPQGSLPRPQGALGSSLDASLGYASKMPFTPNK